MTSKAVRDPEMIRMAEEIRMARRSDREPKC